MSSPPSKWLVDKTKQQVVKWLVDKTASWQNNMSTKWQCYSMYNKRHADMMRSGF
jgi:hypothetical protein